MAHQNRQTSIGSAIADVVPVRPLNAGKPGLSENSSIERYLIQATALDTHVLRQHCVSTWLSRQPVEYGGRLNGKQYISLMQPEFVWFRAAGDSANCWWNQSADGVFLSFDQALIERVMGDQEHLQNFELVSTLQSKPDPALSHLLAALHFDTAAGHLYGAMRGEAILAAAITLLVTGYGATAHHEPRDRKNAPAIRRTMDYIAANLHAPMRVDAIAAEVGVSPSHLHRSFRSATGTSLWSYVLQQRVKKSQRMMRGSKASLLEISLCTGFESYSQFVAAFRRETGLTPSEFRKNSDW